MSGQNHERFEEWLEMELDGELPAREAALLTQHLESCPDCARERSALARVATALEEGRIPVRPDFKSAVMAALPAAGWEARHPRTWRFPLAACFLLATFGGAAAVLSSAGLGRGSSMIGAFFAIGGLLQAGALAGAGLLAATWKGFGLAIGEIASSPLRLGLFAFAVLALDLLLIALVRRRRAAASPSRSDELR